MSASEYHQTTLPGRRETSNVQHRTFNFEGFVERGPRVSPDPERHACFCEFGGRGCELNCFGLCAGLNNDDAMTVEGIALAGAIRVVVAGVAIADPEDSATAAELKADAVVRVGYHPTFGIQNRDGNDKRILSIAMKDGAIGRKLYLRGRIRRFELLGGDRLAIGGSLGQETAWLIRNLPFQETVLRHGFGSEALPV